MISPVPLKTSEPPDDVLEESLMKYASLKLSVAQRLANLAQDHNYHIKYVSCLCSLLSLPTSAIETPN
jgi:hypothetical protein